MLPKSYSQKLDEICREIERSPFPDWQLLHELRQEAATARISDRGIFADKEADPAQLSEKLEDICRRIEYESPIPDWHLFDKLKEEARSLSFQGLLNRFSKKNMDSDR